MNYAMILFILGWVCAFEALFMVVPLGIALYEGNLRVAVSFLAAIVICLLMAGMTSLIPRKNKTLQTKDGMIAVALSWIVLSLIGALPFMWSGEIPHYIDAFFEIVSGFTTTGSSILSDVEALSYASRFWRSFSHWIGGMGVPVFLLAFLPGKGGSFMQLMKAESPGPDVGKLVPRVRDSAKYLYKIYLAMSLIQVVLLLITGMPLFDYLTITMGTAGTGGFAVRNSGMNDYSMLQQAIIAIFMVLFGINFNTYFFLVKGKVKEAFRSEEVITYLVIIGLSTAAITVSCGFLFPNVFEAIHHAFFQVASIITTTGFATADFNEWTTFACAILVLLMFMGACAGSTGGGIKVSRIIILFKGIRKEFHTLLHPRSVYRSRMDGKIIPHEVIRSVTVFLSVYLLIFIFSVLLVSLDGYDLITSFTAVAATLNNIGPGLQLVGPMSNFSYFSDFSKLVLSLDMLAGRLELLPVLLLLIPSMWASRKRSSDSPSRLLHPESGVFARRRKKSAAGSSFRNSVKGTAGGPSV